MKNNIEDAIVPITFLDSKEYNANNDDKHYMGDLNELFIAPYNITTIYRPVTTVEPNDWIINRYQQSIQKSKIAYIQMNVEDLVMNTMIEIISDLTEHVDPFVQFDYKQQLLGLLREQFVNNLYIHRTISSELVKIDYIDITLNDLYTRIVKDIMDPFVVSIATYILPKIEFCRAIYEAYVTDDQESFETVYKSFGNATYCNMVSLIRDVVLNKMASMRSVFDVIKQSYLNMGQYATDYHIDPESKKIVSGNNDYYNYLLNERCTIEGGENV